MDYGQSLTHDLLKEPVDSSLSLPDMHCRVSVPQILTLSVPFGICGSSGLVLKNTRVLNQSLLRALFVHDYII